MVVLFHLVEFYSKAGEVDTEDVSHLLFDESCVHMKVAYGSKVKNLMGYALKQFQSNSVKQIAWTGEGMAFSKTVSCAQTFGNKFKGLHKVNEVRYRRVEEHWQPLMHGLERLKVNRDIPAVTILFSKHPVHLDNNRPAAPRELQNLLKKATKDGVRNEEQTTAQNRNSSKQSKIKTKNQSREDSEKYTEKKTHTFSFKKKSVELKGTGINSTNGLNVCDSGKCHPLKSENEVADKQSQAEPNLERDKNSKHCKIDDHIIEDGGCS